MSNANRAAFSRRAAAATVCVSSRVSPHSNRHTHHALLLLLLQLGLMWVLPLDLVRAFFVFTLRVFLLLLFFEGNEGDQLHRGGTGRPQVQGRVSRIASAAS